MKKPVFQEKDIGSKQEIAGKPQDIINKAIVIGLSEPELMALKSLNENLSFKGKSINTSKSEMEQLLILDEKESIYKFEEIEEKVHKLLTELESTEEKFKTFEKTVTQYNEEFSDFYKNSQRIERQNDLIICRSDNIGKLTDTIKLLFSGIELTKDERDLLINPSFECEDDLSECEKVLEKIGKFLKYSKEKYQNFKGLKVQLDEILSFLKIFIQKFKENLRVLVRKSASKLTDDDITESKLPDTSDIRRAFMSQRRILFNLYLVNAEDKGFFLTMMKEFASVISSHIILLFPRYEKSWKSEILQFSLFRTRLSYKSQEIDESNSQNTKKNLEIDVNKWLDELFLNIIAQLESDEGYFSKYFSYENTAKLKPEDECIAVFMEDTYKAFYMKIEDFFYNLSKISPYFIFLIEISAKNAMKELKNEKYTCFSRIFFVRQLESIGKAKISIEKEFETYLNGIDIDTRHCGVFAQIRNFTKFLVNFALMLPVNDLEIIAQDLVKHTAIMLEFLKKIAKKKEKYEDVVIFGNTCYMIKELDSLNNNVIKLLLQRIKPVFVSYSDNYVRYLFAYQSTKFMDFWYNIKKCTASEINSDNKYSKNTFNKLLKSAFGNLHKSLEKIVKRLKKQLAKDPVLIAKAFSLFSVFYKEYVLKELKDIEKFYEIHYNDHPIIKKTEVELELVEKSKML